MQDFAANFPSLKKADDLTPPAPKTALTSGEERARRTWQQPLGDVHVKLGNIVGSAPLLLRFDASDSEFVFALTSRWPIHADQTASLYEADAIKLADALNGLVRLYAIETGNTKLHVLVEARRGKFEVPSWWQGAPVLIATYAFDTGFAQVGLFSDIADAYADMELIGQPHRLLIALGPATPAHLLRKSEAEEGAYIDPDEERLNALKRWNKQLSMQLNRLIADIYDGGEAAMEAMVDGLSKMRNTSIRLTAQIGRMESRVKAKKKLADGTAPMPAAVSLAPQPQVGEPTVAELLSHIRAGLTRGVTGGGTSGAVMRKNLDALITMENALPKPEPKPEVPVVKPAAKPAAPGIALALLLTLLATPAVAGSCSTGLHSGLGPYPDIMRGCGYMEKDNALRDCRGDVSKAARRKFGRGATVDFVDNSHVTIDGAAYSYTCKSHGVTLTAAD